MSKFFVEYQRKKSREVIDMRLHDAIRYHYCDNKFGEAERVVDFIRDFTRVDYEILNENGKHVGYFSMVVNDDMHLGKVASYVTLFVVESCRGNKEILKLIKWYSERFAKTFGCKYIAKVKHVSPLKRIETFKEVK